MNDINETKPDSTEQPSSSPHPKNDDTRPTRRPGHPDRTRHSSPSPKPPPQPAETPKPSPTHSDREVTQPYRPIRRAEQPAPPGQQPPPTPERPTRHQASPPPNPPTHRATHYRSPLRSPEVMRAQRAAPQAVQPTVAVPVDQPLQPHPSRRRWFARSLGILLFLFIIVGGLLFGSGVIAYFWIASQLPPAQELLARTFKFETTQILDREGNLLWEIIDPTGGRRTQVLIDNISPYLVQATVATEDRFFYANVGVDPIAVMRAVYYNVTEGEIVSGASTITQQLARNVLLDPEERSQQSLSRKIKEAVLAVEINRRYTKDQILEIYLNQIYYGNLAYGIEAAAQTYFGKSAGELTLPEAAILAGLPQSPAFHDPYTNPDGAKARQANVLRLMVEANYITQAEAEEAKKSPLQFRDLDFALNAPHFVNYVRRELEQQIGADYIYQVGLRVQTTLDPRLQAIAEEEISNQIGALAGRNVTNGALVALDVGTGQILAFVGSKDFQDDSIDGQVNMAISPRQPGSSIKPFTYLAAFEQLDWTPSTLIMDTPVEYPDGAGGAYRPKNYDDKFHGPVSVRSALGNSYNIPPVKALALLGVDALKEMAARLGITTLTRDDYGLALTLGSGEVPLVEMTGAYQVMANSGLLIPPTGILQRVDQYGQVSETVPQPRQVLRTEHAYLISHILADNEARTPAFGPNSFLQLSRPAAVKTGTTNDFRDSWTIGYTPDIATGVWVGNANNTQMNGVSGSSGAAPIWHNFMERAHEGRPIRDFARPATIIELEVCADSGTIPSAACPERRAEIFSKDQPPLGPEHDIHQLIDIDRNTGLLANEFCRSNVEQRYYRVYPPDGWEWALSQGYEQPPLNYCPSTNIIAEITSPLDGSTARDTISLEGKAAADNFSHYQIELGLGTTPQDFLVIHGPINQIIEQGVLAIFDTTAVDNGAYTLRLVVFDRSGGSTEARVRLLVDNLPTPTPTETPTEMPTLTPTATATITPTATATITPTATVTEEPPTATPTIPPASPTTPVELPTATPTLLVVTATITPTDIPVITPVITSTMIVTTPTEIPTATPTPTVAP